MSFPLQEDLSSAPSLNLTLASWKSVNSDKPIVSGSCRLRAQRREQDPVSPLG